MARRRNTRKRTTRRRSTSLNIVNVAQTYLQTQIVTQAAFNVNPIEFVTGQQTLDRTTGKRDATTGVVSYSTSQVTGYQPLMNGSAITLPELFGVDRSGLSVSAGGYWAGGSPMEAIKNNIMLNGGYFKPIYQTAILNASFAVGKRVFSKQLGLVRKGLKLGGLSGMVKV